MTGTIRLPRSAQDLDHEVIRADSNGVQYDVWTWVPPNSSIDLHQVNPGTTVTNPASGNKHLVTAISPFWK